MDSPADLVPLDKCIARRWLGWESSTSTGSGSQKPISPLTTNLVLREFHWSSPFKPHGDVISVNSSIPSHQNLDRLLLLTTLTDLSNLNPRGRKRVLNSFLTREPLGHCSTHSFPLPPPISTLHAEHVYSHTPKYFNSLLTKLNKPIKIRHKRQH